MAFCQQNHTTPPKKYLFRDHNSHHWFFQNSPVMSNTVKISSTEKSCIHVYCTLYNIQTTESGNLRASLNISKSLHPNTKGIDKDYLHLSIRHISSVFSFPSLWTSKLLWRLWLQSVEFHAKNTLKWQTYTSDFKCTGTNLLGIWLAPSTRHFKNRVYFSAFGIYTRCWFPTGKFISYSHPLEKNY
jgi:hypothetical protein